MRKLFPVISLLLFVAHPLFAQVNEASSIMPYINQYQADEQMLKRKYPLKQSPEYLDRMDRFYEDWLTKIKKIAFDQLTVNERVDYLLLKRDINADLRENKEALETFILTKFSIPFALAISNFEQKRRVGAQQDGLKTAAMFDQLAKDIEKIEKTVKKGELTLTPTQLKWIGGTLSQYQRVFVDSYKFYDGYDPQFTKATKTDYHHVVEALKNYAETVKGLSIKYQHDDDGSGIIGNPIGKEAFETLLKEEMLAYTPAQLEAIALKEFAWCDKEMLKASKQMGFGKDWKKALEKVKNDYPALGKQPELVYGLAQEAIDFIQQNKLIEVPELAKEGWSMHMLSPQQQLYAPFFLGGESVLIAYPTEDMSEEVKLMTMRGNNKHFSRAVVFHELIPGHNLQYFMQNRYKPYRKVFSTPFWTEGWSLYWEMLLWDHQFAKTPEDKIGMLFWRMHRCARIIFSMNYHLGKWTPKQCIDFLVERVGFERSNAAAEVRRSFTGNYGPLYQIGYMLGGLQFSALHKELVETGKMSNVEFHERILKENTMPVEMVRAILTNQELKEDHATSWKFAGSL
ncbi:DUF885 family protein [Pedobacter sp. ASV28]|uniref:DUF885 family protein n=1 Tax=Pedobacter sp. ASV28 TaxID=2795123 RepID=UPI0018EAF2B3|nr:DUF885 family protein [Pedobacter sp. ASV28]